MWGECAARQKPSFGNDLLPGPAKCSVHGLSGEQPFVSSSACLPLFLPKSVPSFSPSLRAPAELLSARPSGFPQSVFNKWSLTRAARWGAGWEVSSTPHASARVYIYFHSLPFWNSWKSKPREEGSRHLTSGGGVFLICLTRQATLDFRNSSNEFCQSRYVPVENKSALSI